MSESQPKLICGGKYEYIRELARGGFGFVVLAENVITKEKCAIKFLREEKITKHSKLTFNREIDILLRLNNNINNYVPEIYDYQKSIDENEENYKEIQPYLAIEYEEKGCLHYII